MMPPDRRAALVALVLLLLLAIRIYPVAMNAYPKGSDTWYHLEHSQSLLQGSFFFDAQNAGGTYSSYPPLFHLVIAPVLLAPDPLLAARIFSILIGWGAVLAFFLFARRLVGREAGLVATAVFGFAVEIVNTSIYLAPENLGFLFLFLGLFAGLQKQWHAMVILGVLTALTHPLSFLALIVFSALLLEKRTLFLAPGVLVLGIWLALASSAGAQTSLVPGSPLTISHFLFGFSAVFLGFTVIGFTSHRRLAVLFVALALFALSIGWYGERIFTFALIPASLLAGYGFMRAWRDAADITKAGLVIALAIGCMFTLNYNYAQTELRPDDAALLLWIRSNTHENATIAASWQVSGPWVPFLADRNNILGSFQESVPSWRERRQDIATIFSSPDERTVRSTLAKYGASYVYVNAMEEELLYPGVRSRLSAWFAQAASNAYASVYQVDGT